MAITQPEIEWFNDLSTGRTWGVTKVLGTSEWVVVRRYITLFGWSDPRVLFSSEHDMGTENIEVVTIAPSREVAIGYIKLLKEE